jgi:tight adherence protein B
MGPWLAAVFVFLAVVLGTLSVALAVEVLRDWARRRRARKQLEEISTIPAISAAASGLVRIDDGEEGFLSSVVRSLPGVEAARELMRQAHLDMGVDTFVALTVACGIGAGLAAFLLSRSMLLAVPLAGLASFLPYLYVARRRHKRLADFEEQFPEAIELLTRAIRAGHPISSGMRMVADEAPGVVADEFRQTFEEQRFGMPFEDALLGMVDRLDSVDVRIFATALMIQREVGGNLAEILDNLAATIRSRFYIRRQLRVYTAQGRISGWVLGLLPIVVGGIIYLTRPQYISVLLEHPMGLFLIGSFLTLQLIGVMWIRAIVNIDI